MKSAIIGVIVGLLAPETNFQCFQQIADKISTNSYVANVVAALLLATIISGRNTQTLQMLLSKISRTISTPLTIFGFGLIGVSVRSAAAGANSAGLLFVLMGALFILVSKLAPR